VADVGNPVDGGEILGRPPVDDFVDIERLAGLGFESTVAVGGVATLSSFVVLAADQCLFLPIELADRTEKYGSSTR